MLQFMNLNQRVDEDSTEQTLLDAIVEFTKEKLINITMEVS